MNPDRRLVLRRKYLSLGLGELTACVMFAAVAAGLIVPELASPSDGAGLWFALVPLLGVLLQAGAYWLLARSWVERAPMPSMLASLFRAFRVVNVALLTVGLVGVIAFWPDNIALGIAFLAVWAFGVVEYVNYFVVRLSYPATRWVAMVRQWRVPRLVQDLRAAM